MHITLETDYAVRIIIFLIREGKRVDAKNISEGTEVTLRFALKILRKLVAAGFVKSFKGIRGGYEFGKESAKDISLYDVIEAVEGDCLLSRCLDPEIGCNRNYTDMCKVRSTFSDVSDRLQKELQKATFDTLI